MNFRKFYPLILGFLITAILIFAIATKPKPEPEVKNKLTVQDPDNSLPQGSNLIDKSDLNSKKNAVASQIQIESPPDSLSPVEKFVYIESQKLRKPDPNPNHTYSRLKRLAESLKIKDIDSLKSTALDPSLNNDRRFMSVYLLSLNQKDIVLPALMSIALDSVIVSESQPQIYAEELMLRTQALIGIAHFQAPIGTGPLHSYLRKQDNAFLADQAKRLLKERQAAH